MFSQNLAGCSRPLSQAELSYIQHQEMMAAQQKMNRLNQLNQMNRNLKNLRNYNFLKLW